MFKNSVLALICGAAVLMAVNACKGDDDEGSSGGATCEDMCNKTASLDCAETASCSISCQLAEAFREPCGDEIDAAMACAASTPIEEFSCDPDSGRASASACAAKESAVELCIGASLGAGGAGPGAAGSGPGAAGSGPGAAGSAGAG